MQRHYYYMATDLDHSQQYVCVMYHYLALRMPQGLHEQVQMQSCWFQCIALCKCADEYINNEGGGLPVTLNN